MHSRTRHAPSWRTLGKVGRNLAVVAAVAWLAAGLLIPRGVQEVTAGWVNGVLLSIVIGGLAVWSLASLGSQREEQ